MSHTLSLPKEIQMIAKNELNEIPERVEEDIAYIRRWLLQQPHIKARTDDYILLTFLRSCKFSLEKTKKKVELFYTLKTAFPDILKNRDPLLPKFRYALTQNIYGLMPRTSNGPVLILFLAGNANPDILSVYDSLTISSMILDVLFQENAVSSVVGQAAIIDFKNLSAEYIFHITPTFMKKCITCLQNAYPTRMKSLHYINVPPLLLSAYSILKSFLPRKLQDRVTCDASDGKNTIRQYFPLSVLPIEYGGTAGPVADMCAKTRILLTSYREWLLEDDQYGCDQEKKPSSSNFEIDLSSIDGSFRKLEVD